MQVSVQIWVFSKKYSAGLDRFSKICDLKVPLEYIRCTLQTTNSVKQTQQLPFSYLKFMKLFLKAMANAI